MFFRDRHNAEIAVRRFIDNTRSAANDEALLESALTVLRDALRASAACFYAERDGSFRIEAASGSESFPQEVSADDGAIARLRENLHDVDLGDIQCALAGDGYGFALADQSRLIGVLVIRGRGDAEAYDPEERGLVRALAREVATALRAISAAEQMEFIEQLAAGTIDAHSAQERAQALIARDS
jgi:GAF domain-containing protein